MSQRKRSAPPDDILYLECKAKGLVGPARIGRVTFSKTYRTVRYGGREFRRVKGGNKYNHVEVATGAQWWISGPRRDGHDRLYAGGPPVAIDDDVRLEYWTRIRGRPDLVERRTT